MADAEASRIFSELLRVVEKPEEERRREAEEYARAKEARRLAEVERIFNGRVVTIPSRAYDAMLAVLEHGEQAPQWAHDVLTIWKAA